MFKKGRRKRKIEVKPNQSHMSLLVTDVGEMMKGASGPALRDSYLLTIGTYEAQKRRMNREDNCVREEELCFLCSY